MTPKRTKVVKVRVSEDELRDLNEKCPNKQLASWMRNVCLDQKVVRSVKIKGLDPVSLRQFTAIGNNVNQIARALNSDKWSPIHRVLILEQLTRIEDRLESLLSEFVHAH